MRYLMVALTAGILFSSHAVAQECRCETTGSPETIQEVRSTQGRLLTLRIPAAPVTMGSDLGFVCQDPAGSLALARLWMPEHGHGSGPTRLFPAGGDCTRVERLRFTMPGIWELQMRYNDGDTANFSFAVVR